MTTCSYCNKTATRVGDGRDGDFYCDEHVDRAPSTTSPVEDDAIKVGDVFSAYRVDRAPKSPRENGVVDGFCKKAYLGAELDAVILKFADGRRFAYSCGELHDEIVTALDPCALQSVETGSTFSVEGCELIGFDEEGDL